MDYSLALGRLLLSLRTRAGLTLTAAAAAVGMQRPVLSRWESGHRWPQDPEALRALLLLYGATAEERRAVAALWDRVLFPEECGETV